MGKLLTVVTERLLQTERGFRAQTVASGYFAASRHPVTCILLTTAVGWRWQPAFADVDNYAVPIALALGIRSIRVRRARHDALGCRVAP